MKGDFSRDTFIPHKRRDPVEPHDHYSSVRLQQGRVAVDADFNEQVDISGSLRETALVDVIGHCGVPADAEDSYEIYEDAGSLKVTPGRIWVDGVLCQNDDEVDLGPVPVAGRHVAYLEVWQRHVTAVEDPAIREVALGGPDHATRTKTLCRVRLESLAGDEECADLPRDWGPEGNTNGTMAAQAVPPGSPDTPCVVPSQAGYTGLENHLYRVEIHDGGHTADASKPTFKWSRDNGSVLTDWLQRTGSDLTVRSLGRDKVSGFYDAEWIELGHDALDFDDVPGPLVQLDSVMLGEDGHGLLTVAAADAGLLFDPPVDQHAKVRQWDSGPTDIVPGSWLGLEENIQVKFTAGDYRAGDYWLIPARAFIGEYQGSIEWPETPAALPATIAHDGVERQYCKLAVVTVNADGSVDIEDCRPGFPPLTEFQPGCCTVVVRPGDDIQAALDSLPPEGGCVCLKTGTHRIDSTLRIEQSNVALHGESPGTRVVRSNGATMLAVDHPGWNTISDVTIQQIRFELEILQEMDPESYGVIRLQSCDRVLIADCLITANVPYFSAGVLIGRGNDVEVSRTRIERLYTGVWVDTDSLNLAVLDNVIAGWSEDGFDWALEGVHGSQLSGPCRFERNLITGFQRGISLNSETDPTQPPHSTAGRSTIIGNEIWRGRPPEVLPGAPYFGLNVGADLCTIRDNKLGYESEWYGGIRITGTDCRIENNNLSGRRSSSTAEELPVGILVGFPDDAGSLLGTDALVSGNRIVGDLDAIWVANSRGAQILHNRIKGEELRARFGVLVADSDSVCVAGNHINGCVAGVGANRGRNNRILDCTITNCEGGVGTYLQSALEVSRNRIEDTRFAGFMAAGLFGATTLSENRLSHCGTEGLGGFAFGIAVLGAWGALQIESCEVRQTGVAFDGTTKPDRAFGIAALRVLDCSIRGNLITTDPGQRGTANEDRALQLSGLLEIAQTDELILGYSALVLDNRIVGPGASHLIEITNQQTEKVIRRFERVTVSNNSLWHWPRNQVEPSAATVSLRARRAIVIGNHIKSTPAVPSVDFNGTPGVFMGNDTQGGTKNFTAFPNPESAFNLQ